VKEHSLAVLCALREGLSGRELEAATDLGAESLRVEIAALRRARLVRKRGLFGGALEVTDAGVAALDGWETGLRIGLASEGLRRVDPSLPFEATTSWKEAVCVNLAVAPEALRPLVPDVFELDLCGGWAWVSLTASRLQDFGVGRLPRPLRMNFYQATYRAHVRYEALDGEVRRGCYFVRSETNSALMSRAANLLPEFRAHRCGTAPIVMARDQGKLLLTVDTKDAAGKVVLVLDESRAAPELPGGSRFGSMAEARALIVDFYDAYAWEPDAEEVFVLRIERGEWALEVPPIVDSFVGYASAGPFPEGSCHVDSVFAFRDCPYRWLPLIKESRRA